MLDHVLECLPNEACGLLAGQGHEVRVVLPVANAAQSPYRFRMAPDELIRALYAIDETGNELLAVFHSHPQGPSGPSPVDLEESTLETSMHLIWTRKAEDWEVKAYAYVDSGPLEVPLEAGG